MKTPLNAFLGPVATGSAVLENIQLIEEQIKSQQRKVIGIEMEVYGVFNAARYAYEPRPKLMALKSICDFADTEKNDIYNHMQHLRVHNIFIISLLNTYSFLEISSRYCYLQRHKLYW